MWHAQSVTAVFVEKKNVVAVFSWMWKALRHLHTYQIILGIEFNAIFC